MAAKAAVDLVLIMYVLVGLSLALLLAAFFLHVFVQLDTMFVYQDMCFVLSDMCFV